MASNIRKVIGDGVHAIAHTVTGHGGHGVVAKAILPVADMAEAIAFHTALGFTVESWDASYAWVQQPSGEVHHLALVEDLDVGANAAALYLHVDDPDAWHARLTAAGLQPEPIEDTPWGMRESAVTDPSGNRIRFGANC